MPSATTQHMANKRKRVLQFFLDRPQSIQAAQKNLLICATLVLLPHLFQQRWLILAYCLALLGWQLLILLNMTRAPTRIVRMLLTLMALALIFTQQRSMMGQNAGVELLLMMLCLKLTEAKTTRDFTVTHGLCLFVLLTGFLYNSSIIMWAYSLLVIYTLLASVKHTVAMRALPTHRIYLDRSLLKLMTAGLLLSAVMFILLPRPAGPLWGIPTPAGAAITGLNEQMSPGEISQLGDNNSVAFRVKFKGPAPDINRMYWRGPVFTYFNGRSWREPAFAAKYTRFDKATKPALAPQNADTERYHYEVLLNPHNHKWLFTLDSNDAAPPNTHYSAVGQLLAEYPITSTFIYEIDPAQPVMEHDDAAPFSQRYLNLPAVFASRTRQLVAEFKRSIDPSRAYDVQMVLRALKYFRQEPFTYTRRPPRLSKDPVDEFMFNSRAGFCEHYASAFAFMMRQAGIPARIVTGYQGAEYNPAQDYYIVRQSNAHAWVEVWLQNQGWTREDPTMVIPPDRIDRTGMTSQQSQASQQLSRDNLLEHPLQLLGYYLDAVDYQWGRRVVGFDTQYRNRLFTQLQFIPLLPVLLGLIIAIGLIILLYRNKISTQQDPVNRYYQQFCHKLSRRGFRKAAHESANDFARRIIVERPELRHAVQPVTEIYTQLRYSRTPPRDGIKQLRRQVRSISL